MSEPPKPPWFDETHEEELGVPRFYWFDGILEGRLADPRLVHERVDELNAIGHVRLGLEVLGSRFSILPDSEPVKGVAAHEDQRREFVRGLEGLAVALESMGEMESTLRCTEVYDAKVRETLFGVAGTRIHPVSGVRDVSSQDLRHAPSRSSLPASISGLGKGRLLLVGFLFFVVVGIVAWTSGYVDRAFSTAVTELEVDTGPFGDMLEVTRESAWGNYVVEIRRGPGYPARAEQVEERMRGAEDTATRAAINAVADGSDVYVRLEDAEGRVLHFARVELRALLGEDDAKISAKLPGMMAGARLELALDSGKATK